MAERAPSRRLGRPPTQAAAAHARVLDAVCEILRERPARDLTIEMVAKRAGVGKPTLYKWWSTRAALILATFAERLQVSRELVQAATAEQSVRARARRLASEFDGFFGTVMAGLIAEGQGDAAVLRDLYRDHIAPSRAATVAEIERGMAAGELAPDTDPALVVDAVFAPLYFRLMLRSEPITQAYADDLVEHAFRPIRRGQE